VSGWREISLGELGRIVTGKTPSTSVAEFFGGDVPFVTPSDMYGHKVISRTERCLTKVGVAAVKGSFIPKGSAMMSCIGSDMGKVTIAAHDCVGNQQINSIVVSEDFSTDFFQAVRAVLAKGDGEKRKTADDIDHAIRQIISRAVSSDEVVDIFAAAGLKKPDISILSDEFLAEVRDLPHKNLAVETLRQLLNNEIKIRSRKFLIQSRSFAEMLEESIRKYQNRAIEAAAVIEELIALAKQMREVSKRGEKLGLPEDEVAFYDALETNDSAVKALGDENLRFIARELLKTIRENVTIDWTAKESARAQLRVMVKRILRKHGHRLCGLTAKNAKSADIKIQTPSCPLFPCC
jgi:hypothetical protein